MLNNEYTAANIDDDLAEAAFKSGQALGLLSRYNSTAPERTREVYRKMLSFMPQGVIREWVEEGEADG